MHDDVVEFHDFYASPAGLAARRIVLRCIRDMWPDASGLNVAGIGYVVPYLSPFVEEARRTVALTPPRQGAVRWPDKGTEATVLAHEDHLPLPGLSMDRVLLVHALEHSERLRPLLREVWRIMADDGRLLVIAPNRRGIWARMDRTPFGHGHPYTPGQLGRLLRESLFVPSRQAIGLYVPPVRSRMALGSAPAIERIGRRWFTAFGGLLFVEAEKEIYAGALAKEGQPVGRRRYVGVARSMDRGTSGRTEPFRSASRPRTSRPGPR